MGKDFLPMLEQIRAATSWSQEELAHNLGVSFATVNSWLNNRSTPRAKQVLNIERLLVETVGGDQLDETVSHQTIQTALAKRFDLERLTEDVDVLNTLALHLTYHTNTIEGSTMTLSDVNEVIMDNAVLANRTAIEQTEARNHKAALFWLIDQIRASKPNFEITEQLILDIHLRLMNGIISDAGRYRSGHARIKGSNTIVANYRKIPDLIDRLLTELKTEPTTDTVTLIAKTHAEFERIHPFSDGNGRVGRLIMLSQALAANLTPPIIQNERKYAYYKYLELAQTKQTHLSLEGFIAESIINADKILNH